ncbi:MAG: ion channel [Planctomycetota bacterium]
MRTSIESENRDLGFGSVIAGQAGSRLLNRDGSFAIARVGGGVRAFLSLSHALLTATWPTFLLLVVATLVAFNLLFAGLLIACGPGAIAGDEIGGAFGRAFFLSVQTSSTIGYGHLAPANVAAHVVTTIEAICSLLLIALATGLVFARFARAQADLAWSSQALVAPYRGVDGLMFRIANRRRNQIIDLRARVVLSIFGADGVSERSFQELALERTHVTFMPLSWTIVHPIDENSPLHGVDLEEFSRRGGEIIVILNGIDDDTAQPVHAKTSYAAEDIRYGAKFVPVYERDRKAGPIRMDLSRIDEWEPSAPGRGA